MKIEFDVQLGQKDVFAFNMYHSYHRVQIWFFTILGVVITALSFTTLDEVDPMYTVLYFVCGCLFILYTPFSLRTSAKFAMRQGSPMASKLHYIFSPEGVAVRYADEEKQEDANEATPAVSWKQLYKVVETGKYFFIYTSRVNASILPKTQVGDVEAFKSLLQEFVPDYRLKLKK